MRRGRSVWAAVVLALSAAVAPAGGQAKPEKAGDGPLGFGALGTSKEPITVVADNLEYDYKANVVVYRGGVEVTQGNVKLTSDTLNITLQNERARQDGKSAGDGGTANQQGDTSPTNTGRVQEIVAAGNVRIDQGARWAVGGRAVFDQSRRTLVLTENPVLHDGPNEVAGDRVVVYLDEDRSVVEGGQRRVKAVLYPDDKGPPGVPAKARRGPAAAPRQTAGREAR